MYIGIILILIENISRNDIIVEHIYIIYTLYNILYIYDYRYLFSPK